MRRFCMVAVAVGSVLALPAAAHAETFTVDAPTDAALRGAVAAANDLPGPDTVLLNGHTVELTDEELGELDVTDVLTLRGPGTIDGTHMESESIIDARADLTVDGVRIVNSTDRALVVFETVDLQVIGSEFTGNAGAIGFYPSEPAVAAQRADDATLLVADTTFDGNHAPLGGAIDFDPGSANASGNVARSTFVGNIAASEQLARGGAINVDGDVLNVENSTFSANRVAGPSFGSGGGAIAVSGSGSTTLTHVTITGNSALGGARGGGIAGPRIETFGKLSFVPVMVNNSIVAGNQSDLDEDRLAAAALHVDDCDSPVGTGGGNLEGAETCGFRDASDKQNADPRLAALAANGGPTRTHALAADSPAVNVAVAARCLATDQRGIARTASACDSGAYELVAAATQPSTPPPAGGALGEQASNECLSVRRFKIRLRVPRGEEVRKAVVVLNGERIRVKRGKRLTAIIDLRGLTKERYKVKITLHLKGGGKVTGVRRYWTCTPAIRWTKPPKV